MRGSQKNVWLAASVALNLVGVFIVGYVVQRRGGISYLQSLLTSQPVTDEFDANWRARQSHFESLSHQRMRSGAAIVFAGDSLTEGCEWVELFASEEALFLNRGIAGDTTEGIKTRVSTIAALKPAAVFLMIGINDLARGTITVKDIAASIRETQSALRRASPQTVLYLQSLLPVADLVGQPKFVRGMVGELRNADIIRLNAELQQIADGRSTVYVPVASAFLTPTGALNMDFSFDGIHLNGAGCDRWAAEIRVLVRRHGQPRSSSPRP